MTLTFNNYTIGIHEEYVIILLMVCVYIFILCCYLLFVSDLVHGNKMLDNVKCKEVHNLKL